MPIIITLIVLLLIAVAVFVSCVCIVPQSYAYVVQRLGADFPCIFTVLIMLW